MEVAPLPLPACRLCTTRDLMGMKDCWLELKKHPDSGWTMQLVRGRQCLFECSSSSQAWMSTSAPEFISGWAMGSGCYWPSLAWGGMRRGQIACVKVRRTACGYWFSPTLWTPVIGFRSPGLVANSFTGCPRSLYLTSSQVMLGLGCSKDCFKLRVLVLS